MNTDSGHTWGYKEDFNKAIIDLEASRARIKELEASCVEKNLQLKDGFEREHDQDERIKDLEQKLESKESELRMMIQQHCIEMEQKEQELVSVRDDRHRLDDANIQLNHVNAALEQKLASEQSRTLRYKNLLYSQQDQGAEIQRLEQKLAEYEKEFRILQRDHSERFVDLTMARNDYHELKQKLSEALEVIRFYGDERNWLDNDLAGYPPSIRNDSEIGDNIKFSDHITVGGKRAREFLKKHGLEEV